MTVREVKTQILAENLRDKVEKKSFQKLIALRVNEYSHYIPKETLTPFAPTI